MKHVIATTVAILIATTATAGAASAVRHLITGRQIAPGTIQLRNLAPGARPKPGPRGPAGATGPAGPAASNGYQVVKVAWSETGTTTAYCPQGKVAIAGGYDAVDTPHTHEPTVYRNRPTDDGTGWEVGARYSGAYPVETDITTYAVCANA